MIIIVGSLWWWSLSFDHFDDDRYHQRIRKYGNWNQLQPDAAITSSKLSSGGGNPFSRDPASLQPILGRFVTRAETKEALPTILTEILHSEVVWLWPRIWNQSWWRGDSRKIARVSQLSHCPTKLGGTIGHLVAVGGAVGHQVGDQTRWCSGHCGHLLGASA